ncbi:TIGR04222 domain-containing membrane protein [Nocardiopsis sp. CA-288880]|uniref:TIGR04222 domain-containing membrane protein n=1 Tax=Nocardiopsis sp. CA-288880 TaxID=3239995 RepID=UPI003D972B69
MDGSSVLFLVLGAAAGLLVGGVPLLRVVRGHLGLRAALRRSPGPAPAPDPDELSPNELAFLAGGPVRVGETAVVDAFLGDRIRPQAARGFFTLVGPGVPYAHEKDPARRVLVKAFKKRVGVSAREMVRRVVTGRGVEQIRRDLAGARLVVDTPEVRAILERRAGIPRAIRGRRVLSLLVAAVGAGTFFLAEPTNPGLAALVGGLTASALLVVAQAVLAATGGPAVLPNTAAGDEVVSRALERYGSTAALSTAEITRDQAVRRTAVTGFRALRAGGRDRSPSRAVSGDGSPAFSPDLTAANTVSAGGGDAGGGGGAVDQNALCEFAELCQGGTSESGGSSGDGWNGGFDGAGGSGSGGGWGSGGWGGGGGDSGGGGGDGGGGGGGGGD